LIQLILSVLLLSGAAYADKHPYNVSEILDLNVTYQCSAFGVVYGNRIVGLTAGHCCTRDKAVLIILHKNPDEAYIAKIIKVSKDHDLCAIEYPAELGHYQVSTRIPRRGDPITLVGYTADTYTISVDTFTGKFLNYKGYVYSSVNSNGINHGASGGIALNDKKQIVGVISIVSLDGKYTGIVPLSYIKEFLRGIR